MSPTPALRTRTALVDAAAALVRDRLGITEGPKTTVAAVHRAATQAVEELTRDLVDNREALAIAVEQAVVTDPSGTA